jgi:hypothetical protein
MSNNHAKSEGNEFSAGNHTFLDGAVYLLDMSNKVWFKSHQVVLDIGG